MRSLLKRRFAPLVANGLALAWLLASPATAESLSIDELRENAIENYGLQRFLK